MPLREIEEQFTRSELFILAWRSQELHYNLNKDNPTKKNKKRRQPMGPNDMGPQGLPDEYFAQTDIYECRKCRVIGPDKMHCDSLGRLVAREGDLYLSQVSGDKAKNYFGHFGIIFPSGQAGDTVSKIRDDSDESRQIRQAYGIK